VDSAPHDSAGQTHAAAPTTTPPATTTAPAKASPPAQARPTTPAKRTWSTVNAASKQGRPATTTKSSPAAPRPASSATRTAVTKPAPTTPTAAKPPGAAATKAPGAAVATPIKTASSSPSVTPVQTVRPTTTVSKPPPGPEATPVEERVTYQYNAIGRRDPFTPLVGGGYVGADEDMAPPDVGGIKVVGIVWGAEDKFALIEDPRGNSRVLRQGDKVMNGVVDGLRRDAVIVKLTTEGGTELVQIPLTRKGDDNGSR